MCLNCKIVYIKNPDFVVMLFIKVLFLYNYIKNIVAVFVISVAIDMMSIWYILQIQMVVANG